jgi:membrane protein DedA with SNARE-associated domain
MHMESLLGAIAAWGWLVYLTAFLMVFLQSAGLPLPALTFVSMAAALSGHNGEVGFWPIYAATIVGGALGGLAGYAIGISGGRAALDRYGRFLWLTPHRVARGESLFLKHGDKAVLVGRYLPVLCFMASILGGTARMARGRFVAYNVVGIVLWATTQLLVAYYFGFAVKGLF